MSNWSELINPGLWRSLQEEPRPATANQEPDMDRIEWERARAARASYTKRDGYAVTDRRRVKENA